METIAYIVLAALIASAVLWFVITMMIDIHLMGALPFRYDRKTNRPRYMVARPNHIDIQDGLQRSGFASAYLLRSFGKNAKGMQI